MGAHTFILTQEGSSWSGVCQSEADWTPEPVTAESKRALESALRALAAEKAGTSAFSVVCPMVTPTTAVLVLSQPTVVAGAAAPAAAAPAAAAAAAPAKEEKKEAKKEESEEDADMGFGLFD